MHHFCTYFDSHYIDNGIALYRSLDRHCDEFALHIMTLDDKAYRIMDQMNLPKSSLIHFETLEEWDSDLVAVRNTRPRVQYYFTMTPILPLYLLEEVGMDRISYFGSDLYFYSSPGLLVEMMNDASVVVHTHRHDSGYDAKGGRFNADFVSFKNSPIGIECLETWRENCLEWCYGRLEDGKWSCQGYLRWWPEMYDDLKIIDHPGVGLARWNRNRHSLTLEGNEVRVDGEPLIFYHFSNLQRMSFRLWKPPITNMSSIEQTRLYEPYIRELMNAEVMVQERTGESIEYGSFFFPSLGDLGDATWRAIGRSVLSKLEFLMQLLNGDAIVATPQN